MEKSITSYIALLLWFQANHIIAQRDTIQRLKPVVISDQKLTTFSKGHKLTQFREGTLWDSGAASMTDFLRRNATMFLRENGVGGVSSVSFRGTGASQTAVIWNGININSQLNGQTDFNTLSIKNYDHIAIRSGGGSVPYGSGAIGGSIHLNSELRFEKHFTNRLVASLGSFLTASSHYKASYGSQSLSINLGLEHNASENDYLYLGSGGKRNQNGAFENLNANLNLGFYLNPRNLFKLYINTYNGKRNFSGTIFAPSNDAYQDDHKRSLLQWQYRKQQFKSTLSAAYLTEQYRYFPNAQSTNYNFGDSDTFMIKYEVDYFFSDRIKLKGIVDHTSVSGQGTNITANKRTIGSGSLLLQHQLDKKLHYGLQLKQELTNNYQAPLVYALDLSWDWSDHARLKANTSKNFRIPTYNDLYWFGQGNPDLNPETAIQAEIGQEFHGQHWLISATAFYIQTQDLIQWRPDALGVWRPRNVSSTVHQGIELQLDYTKPWKNKALRLQGNYGYTRAENQVTKNQLLYVPLHRLVSTIAYSPHQWTANYQFSWTGRLFLTTDQTQYLPAHEVSNIGLQYHFDTTKNTNYSIGIRANNVYNQSYALVFSRPAPNRNFQIQFTLNF